MFQHIWIIEDKRKLTKLYGVNIPNGNDIKGLELLMYVIVNIIHCEYLLRK